MRLTDDDMDQLLAEWHQSDSTLEIWDYIGITREQYADWAERGTLTKYFGPRSKARKKRPSKRMGGKPL